MQWDLPSAQNAGPWLPWKQLKSRSIRSHSKAPQRLPKVSRALSPTQAVPKSLVRGKYTIINSGLLTQILGRKSLFGPRGSWRFSHNSPHCQSRSSNNASPLRSCVSPIPRPRKADLARTGPARDPRRPQRVLSHYDRGKSSLSCDFDTVPVPPKSKQPTSDISQWSADEDSSSELREL